MKYTELLELCESLQVRNELLTDAAAQVVRGFHTSAWKTSKADVAALAEALAAPINPVQSLLAKYIALQDIADVQERILIRLRDACDTSLKQLIKAFKTADRMRAEKDEPEGTRWVRFSDTCVNDVILAKLISIQKEIANA